MGTSAVCGKKGHYTDSYQSTQSNSSLAKIGRRATMCKEDFKILKVIGRGSFGKVFLVEKKESGDIFAMKVLKKESILERNQVDHTKTERSVLQNVNSPFLMKMHYAFQTPEKLYMVMDFLNGGELFFHLRREQRFSEDKIRFYASEIILGLQALHENGTIYRDLKPENILLDDEGHIRLTDFGLSKQGIFRQNKDMTYTICGTPEYLAPEIIRGEGHGKAVDWWSLGTLLYEMYVGKPPFQNQNKMQLLYTIATKKVDFSKLSRASPEFQNLIKRLLTHDPNKRLGGSDEDADQLKKHAFFKNVDWEAVANKEVEPVIKPTVEHHKDTRNIDRTFLNEKPVDSPVISKLTGSQAQKVYFEKFTYARDDEFLMQTDVN